MSPIPVRPASLLHRKIGDEVIVYHPDTSEANTLKGDAGRIWLACDRGVSVEVLALELDLTTDEVTEYVTKLIEIRLLDDARGPSRRVFVRGGAVLGGTALIASVHIPEAAAAVSKKFDSNLQVTAGSYFIPATAHNVIITLAGAAGGASASAATAGAGATVTWNPTSTLAAGQTVTFTIGKLGGNGTAAAPGLGGVGSPKGGNGGLTATTVPGQGSGGGGGGTTALLNGVKASAGGGGGAGQAGGPSAGGIGGLGGGGLSGAGAAGGDGAGGNLKSGGAGGTTANAAIAGTDASISGADTSGPGGGGGGGGASAGGTTNGANKGGGGGGGGACALPTGASVSGINAGDGFFQLTYLY